MKHLLPILIAGLIFSFYGCQKNKVSQDAVQLSVDFTWEGMKRYDWGNSEIHVTGIREKTKFIKISMYDQAYKHDHGTVLAPYTGNGIIVRDRLKKYRDHVRSEVPVDIKLRSRPLMKKISL